MDFSTILLQFVLRILVVIPSIILHEVAHGYAALRCGDDTAKRAGRLTFNPLPHLDLWGTVVMPVMLLVLSNGLFTFGYAKPVPINPWRFRNEREGIMITGIAGPAANIALAIVTGLLVRLLGTILAPSAVGSVVLSLLDYFCMINLALAFFNLIPIPPLDGSRVLQRFLSPRARDAYISIERYGFIIVLAIIFFLPKLFNGYIAMTVTPIFRLLTGS
jgi:Zn-dependent protease